MAVTTKELRENKENILKNVCVFSIFYVYYCHEKFNDSNRALGRNRRKSQLQQWPPAVYLVVGLVDFRRGMTAAADQFIKISKDRFLIYSSIFFLSISDQITINQINFSQKPNLLFFLTPKMFYGPGFFNLIVSLKHMFHYHFIDHVIIIFWTKYYTPNLL